MPSTRGLTVAPTRDDSRRGSSSTNARLLGLGRTTRRFLVLAVLLGILSAILVIAQAWLLARAVSGAFIANENLADLQSTIVVLLGVLVARAVVVWFSEVAADRSSARVKSQLRTALLEHVAEAGPRGLVTRRPGDIVTLATRGIDALDGYFGRYLPQLILAVIVPVAVLAAVVSQDWISAAIIAVTVPLIPVFMVLVGWMTRQHTDRQLHTLQRLSGHFLDVVAGLSTLKVFGRSQAQVTAIRDVADRYRRTTMATLRVAFLSALVLELLASVAVALVAVAVGLRLLHGHIDLQTALFVLILAPEAFLPLRLVGSNYHASAEGLSAAEKVFEILDEPAANTRPRAAVPDMAAAGLVVEGLRVQYSGTDHAALDEVSFAVRPGEVVAITGPSGCGKSTLLGVLLGFVVPQAGSVHVGDADLAELDPDAWRRQLAWVPQRPHLFSASLDSNVRLGATDASHASVDRAIAAAGLSDLVNRLPLGLATSLGERGAGLSAGERQRVALARAFLRDASMLLLDEPTANLDGETEAEVLTAIQRLVRGRTVILVAHRPALVALADRVVGLDPARAVA